MTSRNSFHALRFGRAAARYEERARVQARMADALLELWGSRPEPSGILEFGCGTGLLTRRLRARFPDADLLATDASPEMLDVARAQSGTSGADGDPGVRYAVLDARGDIFASRPGTRRILPELLASGALVQWLPDLTGHLRFAAASAAPNAHYLLSGFTQANFPELNALLSEPPFSYREFPGHSPDAVERAARATGWNPVAQLAWEEREILPTARAVLKRMQELGSVRDPRAGGRMNRANLAHLLAEYERRFSVGEGDGGVRLTWKPWVALLIKRG